MNRLSYWQRRALEDEKAINDGAKKVEKTIVSAYRQVQEYLTQKAKELFKRAQAKTGYEEAELKTLLNETVPIEQLVELQRLSKDISDPDLQASAKKRLDALAVKHRITRAEDLKAKAHLVTRQIADVQLSESTGYFVEAIQKAYQREQANVAIQRLEAKGVQLEVWSQTDWEKTESEFKQLSTKETRNILESHWHGSNYSKRIWNDTDKLAKRLEELFTVEALTGMSQQDMVRTISKEFDTSVGVARRLIRTEANYMANQAKLKSWIDNGVEYYRLVVVLDFRTSSICQLKSKENKRYKVSEAVVNGAEGNYPPFHPWCRTIAIADFGKRTAAGNRIANDPISGKTFNLPQRATYEDWINKLRESYSDDEIAKHKEMILNRSKDNDQYRHMKTIIPKENWPTNLDSFQEIKYNDGRDWQLTKLDYQRRKRLLNNPDLKLPNADKATIDDRKFTEYLFNENSKSGYPKGKIISERFGYSKDNYLSFKSEILKRSMSYPANHRGTSKYGDSYEQKMIFYTPNGKPYNFVVGWLVDGAQTKLTTIMIKEVK
ncbi:minor capsid protein [Enterococcus asini]|uniref:minor capsid protein n=1 Tax=Enterococcus asini TaxID=57732 RepID=UPI0031192644